MSIVCLYVSAAHCQAGKDRNMRQRCCLIKDILYPVSWLWASVQPWAKCFLHMWAEQLEHHPLGLNRQLRVEQLTTRLSGTCLTMIKYLLCVWNLLLGAVKAKCMKSIGISLTGWQWWQMAQVTDAFVLFPPPRNYHNHVLAVQILQVVWG